MTASRILSHLFKQNWRAYFGKRNLYQPSGKKPNPAFQYLDYLQSSAGKKAISILIPGISMATGFGLIAGDWFFFNTYINNFETLEDESNRRLAHRVIYTGERPYNHSEAMTSLSYEVAKDLGLTETAAKEIRLFMSNSPYALPLGVQKHNLITPVIGYPFFMDWTSSPDVKLEGAVIKTYWNPVSAKGFEFTNTDISSEEKENFIFSDRARKFMLGKALLDTDSERIVVRLLIPIIGTNAAYFIIRTMKGRFKALFSTLSMRLILYSGISLPFASLMLLTYALDTLEREYSNIRTLCSMSEDYRMGGVEYYSKIQRIYAFLYKHIRYNDFYFTEDGEMTLPWYMCADKALSSLQGRIEFCEKFSATEENKNLLEKLSPF